VNKPGMGQSIRHHLTQLPHAIIHRWVGPPIHVNNGTYAAISSDHKSTYRMMLFLFM